MSTSTHAVTQRPSISRLASPCWLPFLVATIAGNMGAQAPTSGRRDTVYGSIVGRHETAQVWIDFASAPGPLREAWSRDSAPASPGLGAPVLLRSTAALQVGTVWLPAGHYQLWVALPASGPTLIVTTYHEPGTATFPPLDEVARTGLTVQQSGAEIDGLQIAIRLNRRGPDTLGIIDRSSKTRTVMEYEVRPGASALLVFMAGHVAMSVSLVAR